MAESNEYEELPGTPSESNHEELMTVAENCRSQVVPASENTDRSPAVQDKLGPESALLLNLNAEEKKNSEAVYYDKIKGVIHRDSFPYFLPAIIVLVILVFIIYRGIAERTTKSEALFDKIAGSNDKIETVRTLRHSEHHEIYYGFFVVIFGLVFIGLGAFGFIMSHSLTKDAAQKKDRDVLDIHGKVKAVTDYFSGKKAAAAKRETIKSLQREHESREKTLKEKVKRLESENKQASDTMQKQQILQAATEKELQDQREKSKANEDALRQRAFKAEKHEAEAKSEVQKERALKDAEKDKPGVIRSIFRWVW